MGLRWWSIIRIWIWIWIWIDTHWLFSITINSRWIILVGGDGVDPLDLLTNWLLDGDGDGAAAVILQLKLIGGDSDVCLFILLFPLIALDVYDGLLVEIVVRWFGTDGHLRRFYGDGDGRVLFELLFDVKGDCYDRALQVRFVVAKGEIGNFGG